MDHVDRFAIGDVLRAAFAAYARNVLPLVGLSLLAYAPVCVWLAAADALATLSANDPVLTLLFALFGSILTPACAYWLQAAVTYCVIRDLRGGRPAFAELVTQAFRGTPYAVVAALLVGLATGLGLLLLVIPGVVLFLMFWVAVPAAVVERRLGSALPRSHRLTTGHKWPLLGLTMLLLLAVIAVAVLATLPLAISAPSLAPFLTILLSVLVQPPWATVVAVAYHRLRVLRDGPDGAIAKVFD